MRKLFNTELRDNKYLFIVLFLIAVGCGTKENEATVPDHVREMDNVTIFSEEDVEKAATINLIKEQEFGDTDDVYINRVREFITDDSGRLFITDVAPGTLTIHVFSPDGVHITSLGSKGNGPGEFNGLCCLNIRSNKLYVADVLLARITMFSTDTWDLLETISMDRNKLDSSGQIKDKRLWRHYSLNDETRLLAFMRSQKFFENTPGSVHYFTADTAFRELGEEVLEQDQVLEVWGDWNGNRIMKLFPFLKKPLLTVTPSGRIFFADSDQFLIREMNKEGDVVGGFYYPFSKIPVTREDARNSTNEMAKDIAEKVELPESWAVMQSMWSDDSGRLWISTFTESEDELEWFVVESDGELIGKFRLPGDREASPYINGSTFKHIRGNHFYTREEDEETGLQTVVRYRIELETN